MSEGSLAQYLRDMDNDSTRPFFIYASHILLYTVQPHCSWRIKEAAFSSSYALWGVVLVCAGGVICDPYKFSVPEGKPNLRHGEGGKRGAVPEVKPNQGHIL